MKTLVIHPKDPTTDFLSVIYADKDWTLVNTNISKSLLKKMIKDHDRIVMLGHGCDRGLFGQFGHIVIDSQFVYLLRDKLCVCIWCNADQFVKKYDLKGFYTGMIISDMDEVNYFLHMFDLPQSDVDFSNKLFADSVKNSIDSDNMLTLMRDSYNGDNDVIDYNKYNLYQKI